MPQPGGEATAVIRSVAIRSDRTLSNEDGCCQPRCKDPALAANCPTRLGTEISLSQHCFGLVRVGRYQVDRQLLDDLEDEIQLDRSQWNTPRGDGTV